MKNEELNVLIDEVNNIQVLNKTERSRAFYIQNVFDNKLCVIRLSRIKVDAFRLVCNIFSKGGFIIKLFARDENKKKKHHLVYM